MRAIQLLLLSAVTGCYAIMNSLDNAMPTLKVTRVYEGEPRPRSEVARIRWFTDVNEGVGQPEVAGEANEIEVRIRSVDGVSCGETPGGGHYYEILPGTCILEISWRKLVSSKPLVPNVKPHYQRETLGGRIQLAVTVEAGKRYALKITPTGYGAPDLELEEL